MLDCIIIGAGPAGMTAAIYLIRKKVKVLIISADFGGQMAKAPEIENYPGIMKISGGELTNKMKEQVEELGVEIKNEAVTSVEKKGDGFEVNIGSPSTTLGTSEKIETKSILITSGKTHRHLNVPGEKEFTGKGVGYCVTCDGPLFKDKPVAIVGGGNSALDGALELSKYAEKVYILNLRESFQGDEVRVDEVKKSDKIEIITLAKTIELTGDKFLQKLKYQNTKDNTEKEIAVNGCFVEIGWQPAASSVKDLVELTQIGEIKTDPDGKTTCSGIYAAGDVTNVANKQIIIAAGTAANAALNLWKWLIVNKAKK